MINNKNIIKGHSRMKMIRAVEDEIAFRYYKDQLMRCPVHLSIGQEAAAVGVCENLKRNDYIFSNHRCHAHYLAKGGDLNSMICEIHGKANGCVGGRGGSMHLQDDSVNFLGSFPIVGSAIPLAIGVAMNIKRLKKNSIVVSFLGDGAVEEGSFHESLNFASVFKLPILFVVENNFFSIQTHIKDRQASDNFTRFANSNLIESAKCDGNNFIDTFTNAKKVIKEVRKSKPYLLQLDTYRFVEHCGPNSDDHLKYRDNKELNHWLKKCPIAHIEKFMLKNNIIKQEYLIKLSSKIHSKVMRAFNLALKSPLPKSKDASKYSYAK